MLIQSKLDRRITVNIIFSLNLPILLVPDVLTIIGCSITFAAKRPVVPIICCAVPPGCCCNCIIRAADKFVDGKTFAVDVTPVTVVLRGELEALLPTFAFETPVANVDVKLGALILILVVFNLAAENDLAKGIGRI